MHILTVIPIKRGISKDTLTYFTKTDAPIGSIVSISIRRKKSYGLVLESREAREIKSELKSLAYNIRKVENIKTHTFLSDSFIKSAEKIAEYNASSVGSVLSVMIPKTILEASENLPYTRKTISQGIFHEILLVQSDNEERYATYRSLIREEFAKNRSVFFCLPTTEDLLNAGGVLEKGIENYTYILHSELSKKEILNLWKKIISEEHPVLIIATGFFLSIPRDDIGTIILEKESSRGFKMQSRPFLDIRTIAKIIAKQKNIRLVFGDTMLQIETLWESKNQNKNTSYSDLVPLKFRSLITANCEIIDMRAPQDMKKKEFAIFSTELKNLLRKSKENNENVFLFCGRKGLYPITVCSDCGTVVTCKNCDSPVVLYGKLTPNKSKASHGNLFVCHSCGERRLANELCKHCGGWRLNPLGIGTERVAEEIYSIYPKSNVVIMDKDHLSTHKQAVKARNLFYTTPGSIMVGTEMALTYLNQKIENTSVVSIDSFFSIPDFRIHEKIFNIILSMRALSSKEMLIQTRQENAKIFDYASRGNLIDFYRDEIEERKLVDYPPFTKFVKITLEGERSVVKKEMLQIVETMKPFELKVFDSFNPGSKSRHSINGLICLKRDDWVNHELLKKLRSLPPYCLVKVDPDTLL